MTQAVEELTEAVEALRTALPSVPRTAVVLGSGLGGLERRLAEPVAVPFGRLPGLPGAGVSGHAGRFVFGRLGSVDVVLQAGRFHAYEGHPSRVIVAPVRILAGLGVRTILMTNAAGGIHRLFEPGDIVLLTDQIDFTFRGPLIGPVVGDEPRLTDMTAPFDAVLGDVVRSAASDLGVELKHGTYAGVLGPAYETPAEVRMLARLGADVVGMSTVPEVITASALGLRCAALSLVTNKATGLAAEPLSHHDVLDVGREAGERVSRLVVEVISRLAAEPSPDASAQSTGAK